MKKAPIGSISSGTMREEDLIPTFADWLRDLDSLQEHHYLIQQADAWTELDAEAWEKLASELTGAQLAAKLEEGSFILEELFDALDGFSPSHCYFGASEGDGACYGWWVSFDSLEDDCRSGEVLKVDDLADVPPDYAGEVLHVNDHGNAALYNANGGKLEEVWSVA